MSTIRAAWMVAGTLSRSDAETLTARVWREAMTGRLVVGAVNSADLARVAVVRGRFCPTTRFEPTYEQANSLLHDGKACFSDPLDMPRLSQGRKAQPAH